MHAHARPSHVQISPRPLALLPELGCGLVCSICQCISLVVPAARARKVAEARVRETVTRADLAKAARAAARARVRSRVFKLLVHNT